MAVSGGGFVTEPGDRNLVVAIAADGSATVSDLAEAGAAGPVGDGVVWVHLNHRDPAARDWLHRRSGIDPVAVEALLAEETRPRVSPLGGGAVVVLRGVNLNPGAVPEDMISLRCWVEPGRVVTVRLRRLRAVEDVLEAVARGQSPRSAGALAALLAERMTARMEPIILGFDSDLDRVEMEVATQPTREARAHLASLRRRAAVLRRYIGPQRDALLKLGQDGGPLLSSAEAAELRETANDIARHVEALNAAWERSAVLQDEISNRLAEQLNSRLYLLSMITGLFLPLSFVTGLLGINVGGMPGVEDGAAFWIVCGVLAVLAALELALFRKLKWI